MKSPVDTSVEAVDRTVLRSIKDVSAKKPTKNKTSFRLKFHKGCRPVRRPFPRAGGLSSAARKDFPMTSMYRCVSPR